MTPSQVISVVRDLVIIAALGFVLWYVHRADTNAVKVSDLKAVIQQMNANAEQVAKWRQEQTDAETQRNAEMALIGGAISRQRAPVLLCDRPAGAGAVSADPAKAGGQPAGGLGSNAGSREGAAPVDIRDAINAFELKYEGALASCRSVLAQWPK